MSETLIQIVDEDDIPLRGGTMDEAQFGGLWHRIVRVMVSDGGGRWLLQKVPDNAFYYAGQWNTSASGHVDNGEEYIHAAAREAKEETGLDVKEGGLEEVDYYASQHTMGEDRTFLRRNKTYVTTIPSANISKYNTEEVVELRWFTEPELQRLVGEQGQLATEGLKRFISNYIKKGQHEEFLSSV